MSLLSELGKRVGISKESQRRLTGQVPLVGPLLQGRGNAPQVPTPQGPGGSSTVFGGTITLPGGISIGGGFGTGRNTPLGHNPGGNGAGACGSSCPSGYRLNKAGWHYVNGQRVFSAAGTRCVRSRKMDPMNVSALKRADRRIESFSGISRKVLKSLGYAVSKSRGPGASTGVPSRGKKKGGCGCK